MVKRTPPLAIAVIGTGETSAKNAEALLNDYTSPYADVALILPVDDEHWSPTLDIIHAWAVANEIPYVAVTDGSSPSKALVPVLEGADSTIKVARVSTKMVQLLKEEATNEGADVALLVAWDDDDQESVLAVNKALSSEVTALNFCDGLDPFEFDDGEGGDGEPADEAAAGAPDEPIKAPSDDYDTKGIRALRSLLREREGHGLSDRQIGQLEKADAIKALRLVDSGVVKADAPQEAEEPVEETRTTRARRAFAEGAAEGRGDEAQAELPNSRGGDILETEGPYAAEESREPTTQAAVATVDGDYRDEGLRHRALELAISGGKNGSEAIADAIKYEVYLRGERQSAGRPRADGTPAQPREVGEDGKPVRRRPRRSTED